MSDAYWIHAKHEGHDIWIGCTAEKPSQVSALIESHIHEEALRNTARVIPMQENEGCADCPHFETCRQSSWNERRWSAGPEEAGDERTLSSVHRCPACLEMVFDIWADEEARVVPPACPRAHEVNGCAITCSACDHQERAYRDLSPRHRKAMSTLASGLTRLLSSRKQEGIEDRVTAFAKAASEAMTPKFPRTEDFALAQMAFGVLSQSFMSNESLREAWQMMDEGRQAMAVGETVEVLHYVGKEYAGTADLPFHLARCFQLMFMRLPTISRALPRMELAERQRIVQELHDLMRVTYTPREHEA